MKVSRIIDNISYATVGRRCEEQDSYWLSNFTAGANKQLSEEN
jgi:hypothetical protein